MTGFMLFKWSMTILLNFLCKFVNCYIKNIVDNSFDIFEKNFTDDEEDIINVIEASVL